MAQISRKLRSVKTFNGSGVAFWCPGCKELHTICTKNDKNVGAAWTWDGNVDDPTFSPSILVTSGHYVPNHTGKCWCDYNKEHPDDISFTCDRCHSFVKNGQIQFLSDCTHKLANQTVALPDLPNNCY